MNPRRRPVVVSRWLYGSITIPKDAPRAHRRALRRILRVAARAARNCGERWRVNSSYRSYAEQAELYRRYKAGKGPLAAPPGSSMHNYGRALDVSGPDGRPVGQDDRRRRKLKKFGLCLPVVGEPWHVELGNDWRA